jgi:hypothetical protein
LQSSTKTQWTFLFMFCHFGELLANLTLMERSWFLFSFSWGKGWWGCCCCYSIGMEMFRLDILPPIYQKWTSVVSFFCSFSSLTLRCLESIVLVHSPTNNLHFSNMVSKLQAKVQSILSHDAPTWFKLNWNGHTIQLSMALKSWLDLG